VHLILFPPLLSSYCIFFEGSTNEVGLFGPDSPEFATHNKHTRFVVIILSQKSQTLSFSLNPRTRSYECFNWRLEKYNDWQNIQSHLAYIYYYFSLVQRYTSSHNIVLNIDLYDVSWQFDLSGGARKEKVVVPNAAKSVCPGIPLSYEARH